MQEIQIVRMQKSCLVPRPQYFDSVIRFGSRGRGQKVWPRQKSEKLDNLSHSSTEPTSSREREFFEHFGRGTAREKHFKLLAVGLMLGPVHTNPFSNENGAILLRFQKVLRPHLSFSYCFRPSTLQHRIRFENAVIPSVRML